MENDEEAKTEAIALCRRGALSNPLRLGTLDPRGNVGKYIYKGHGFDISVMKDMFDGTPVRETLHMTYSGNGNWKEELHKIYLEKCKRKVMA